MCVLIWMGFFLFLNDSMELKISSPNCSIALFCFINSEFQNTTVSKAVLNAGLNVRRAQEILGLLLTVSRCA